jgi:hypothetical protein
VAGTAADVSLVIEEVDSELLQLAGVCQDAEAYPDLDPGKAVFRRSQLLDAVPVGNAYMRKMSEQMDPANPALGQRKVIQLMVRCEKRLGHQI